MCKEIESDNKTSGKIEFNDDISIVLCGEAGKGIQTVERILVEILKESGLNVFGTKEYMSRIRGGSNSVTIRVSSKRVASPLERIDILVPLDSSAVHHLHNRISAKTLVLADLSQLSGVTDGIPSKVLDIPLLRYASRLGNAIYTNIIATGIIACLLHVDIALCEKAVIGRFSKVKKGVVENNLQAIRMGFDIAGELMEASGVTIHMDRCSEITNEILINGAEAVGLGAVAGGCNFISSYPMSPSTGVLVLLSSLARKFNIVAEQAEDEISAVNMALGAWYAGARAMVTTSGGGFALMEEGISLAGMHELPLVVHLAQRPGPATGLPTRTEQADLNLVLYSGHGEFPRAIFAPGTTQEAFELTRYAFDLADEFQIPVFILTDQYFIDSYYNIPDFPLLHAEVEDRIIETTKDYRRYEITDSGISPRGIPGFGVGLVSVDSDEHDEDGHITEDLELRVRMQDKRMSKLKGLRERTLTPTLIGSVNPKILIVCWGSTFHPVVEAVNVIGDPRVGVLHFKQIYPVGESVNGILERASKLIFVEGNSTAQFSNLIQQSLSRTINHRILKYNGLQFSVEELARDINLILKEGD